MVLDRLTGHKATACCFIEEDRDGDRVAEYGVLCTADYVQHDPSMPLESVGLDEARETYRELVAAFRLRHSVEGMLAERDLVSARFRVRGRHVGEYQGNAPTGRSFETTGQVTLRFREGKIAEAWFHWDLRGALEQLGGTLG
ncbi:ester cyclase [Actinomadura roseirufa]|uniref:ester cyclase n=1 Tax=Actinomadura roseirufa TaxID=2094049 RepID=UPI001041119F|nr:ester cyclase [Actinomadura roseirufa]